MVVEVSQPICWHLIYRLLICDGHSMFYSACRNAFSFRHDEDVIDLVSKTRRVT